MQLEKELAKKYILIIDDKVEARSSLKRMLTSLGAVHIYTALDGIEGMQKMGERDYDMVFSDYNLGKGKDGQQVLEEARHIKLLKASAMFIMITSENAIDMVMGALEYEPDDYITRPFSLKVLQERLQQSLYIKKKMQSVNQALDNNDRQAAIAQCLQVIKKYPRIKMSVARTLGNLYLKDKQYPQAEAIYKNLAEQQEISWVQLGLAVCHYHQARFDEAEALLKQTLIAYPLYVQCHDWLAKIYVHKQQPKKALKELERATDISPKVILRQMELGDLALQTQQYSIARNAFSHAITLGQHSCYKNKSNNLNYVTSVIEELPNLSSFREKQLHIRKANKALNDFRAESNAQFDMLYSSAILEYKLAIATNDKERQRAALDKAHDYQKNMEALSKQQKIELVKLQISNNQHIRARQHLFELKQGSLSNTDEIKLYELESKLDPVVIREYAATLNERGVELYSQKLYDEAACVFNEAITFEEAGTSVLMNAIQTKLTYAENHPEVAKQQAQECTPIFARIHQLSPEDKRYSRYQELKKRWHSFKHQPVQQDT